jgi:hypothetical protein
MGLLRIQEPVMRREKFTLVFYCFCTLSARVQMLALEVISKMAVL